MTSEEIKEGMERGGIFIRDLMLCELVLELKRLNANLESVTEDETDYAAGTPRKRLAVRTGSCGCG
jgi:hypothetical protein